MFRIINDEKKIMTEKYFKINGGTIPQKWVFRVVYNIKQNGSFVRMNLYKYL